MLINKMDSPLVVGNRRIMPGEEVSAVDKEILDLLLERGFVGEQVEIPVAMRPGREINAEFIEKLESKKFDEFLPAIKQYINNSLRRESLLRTLFDTKRILPDELDPDVDNDYPSIICEKDKNAKKATFAPTDLNGSLHYFTGPRYRVPLQTIELKRKKISKYNLLVSSDSIIDIIDKKVKILCGYEDVLLFEAINSIIKDNSREQMVRVILKSGSYKDAFFEGIASLNRLDYSCDKILKHENTFLHFIKEDNGNINSQKELFGLPVVTTTNKIIKENEIFFFKPQSEFIKPLILEEAELSVKMEENYIILYLYEVLGIGFTDAKGVVKVSII